MSDDPLKDVMLRLFADMGYHPTLRGGNIDGSKEERLGHSIHHEWKNLRDEMERGSEGWLYWRGLTDGMFACIRLLEWRLMDINFTSRMEERGRGWFRRDLYEQ